MKWALSSSALLLLLEIQRILTELLPHFSGPVQESVGALEGLEYRQQLGAPCSLPYFRCHQSSARDVGDSTLNPGLPIPLHKATPRTARLYFIFANWNALVGQLFLGGVMGTAVLLYYFC